MGVSNTSENIQIKIKMPNPSQEPPESFKAPNEDLKDIDVFFKFKIKTESQNSAALKDPNEDLKDMDVLCTFKIMIGSQNLDHGCI